MATVIRPPLIIKTEPSTARPALTSQSGVLQNLLTTTLAVAIVATTPFHNYDFPNPIPAPSRQAAILSQPAPNLLESTLYDATVTYTREPASWRYTPRDPSVAISSQADVPPNRALLLPVGAKPFPALDYPNPTIATSRFQAVRSQEGVRGVALELHPAGIAPFSQLNWPLPVLRRPPNFNVNFLNIANINIGIPPPPVPLNRDRIIGFPPVPEFMTDDKEHRRQIARAVNTLRQAKFNAYQDVTLTAGALTTTLTDARIGVTSAICPAMAKTASGATAIVSGIWISDQKTGSCTINHASAVATDQTIRFTIIG